MSLNLLHGARVQRGLSLHDVASSTRLSPRIVRALDTGRFEQLPAGLYARAYVRAFAAAVGLDPESALAELGQELPKPVELVPELLDRVRHSSQRPAGGIVRDIAVDVTLLAVVSLLLVSVVAACCGVPARMLLRVAPGAMIGLCAPVWVVYEVLLGLCAQRMFWSGSSFVIPSSLGILSFFGVSPRRPVSRFNAASSESFAAAAASVIRFTRSPGSFFRS